MEQKESLAKETFKKIILGIFVVSLISFVSSGLVWLVQKFNSRDVPEWIIWILLVSAPLFIISLALVAFTMK